MQSNRVHTRWASNKSQRERRLELLKGNQKDNINIMYREDHVLLQLRLTNWLAPKEVHQCAYDLHMHSSGEHMSQCFIAACRAALVVISCNCFVRLMWPTVWLNYSEQMLGVCSVNFDLNPADSAEAADCETTESTVDTRGPLLPPRMRLICWYHKLVMLSS